MFDESGPCSPDKIIVPFSASLIKRGTRSGLEKRAIERNLLKQQKISNQALCLCPISFNFSIWKVSHVGFGMYYLFSNEINTNESDERKREFRAARACIWLPSGCTTSEALLNRLVVLFFSSGKHQSVTKHLSTGISGSN